MKEFTYGPVELLLVAFEAEEPSPDIVEAIRELIEAETIRLLDLVVVERSLDDTLTVTDIEDVTDQYGFGEIELEATGIAPTADIEEMAALVEPGRSAALAVIEHVWAKKLASTVAQSGGYVVSTERIPASIVNAELAAISADD